MIRYPCRTEHRLTGSRTTSNCLSGVQHNFQVYLIQLRLLAGEGEGEPDRELLVFDAVFLHEVAKTLCHMVEQLE